LKKVQTTLTAIFQNQLAAPHQEVL